MCDLTVSLPRAYVDLSKCPFEFASPEFLSYHLKNLVAQEARVLKELKEIHYEEEVTFVLPPEGTKVLTQYALVLKEVERILLNPEVYGHPSDPYYQKRKELLKKLYDTAFKSPVVAVKLLKEYKEPTPSKALFMEGYRKFKAWILGIAKAIEETALYQLVLKHGDLRKAFLSLLGLQYYFFVDTIRLTVPEDAKPVEGPKGRYKLPYGIEVEVFYQESKDMYYYTIRNTYLEGLGKEQKKMLKELIDREMKENFIHADYNILFNEKVNEYKRYFMEEAILKNIPLTPEQALGMAREAASWVVGLGAPIENIALDRENITDIYIDSENAPIYMEHHEFGIVHTPYRYNRELVERAFMNAVLSEKGKKFDENNPVVDVVVKRLSMRCHFQRPPATFGEFQGALRLLREEPFNYALYLYFKSFTPFFVGYDDVLVTLGASEAVLGLKGVGKTSFTAAKILAIGPNKRIIPIQDIEEIPVRAFRKRGFHIGAAKVASGDIELTREGKVLDLVSMTNALLRMGDAAIIINEVRSRSAVQGIINLLNTQPGVFLLYNLHSESLEDVRDRLELVFGIPAASMFATDRYTFLKKIRFGRKGKIYRVLGYEYESDRKAKKFVKIFDFERGKNIDESVIKALFLNNKEASQRSFKGLSLKALEKELDITFLPPALVRRSDETGIKPEQYILQAFFKGLVYWSVYDAYEKTGRKELLGLDFVFLANTEANKIIKELENEVGEVDFGAAQKVWEGRLRELVASFKA